MHRREFLFYTSTVAALGSFASIARAAVWVPDFNAIRLEDTGLNASQWQTLAVVQAHLLPSEKEAPGAVDVNATAYLQWVLSDPGLDGDRRQFIADGVVRLEKLSLESAGKGFRDLAEAERESVLRQMERQGGAWIADVLNYLFEALLTDPVYGANPEGIGWKWLGHTPGYKRPPASKRYFLL